jgi:hypothetical protein
MKMAQMPEKAEQGENYCLFSRHCSNNQIKQKKQVRVK